MGRWRQESGVHSVIMNSQVSIAAAEQFPAPRRLYLRKDICAAGLSLCTDGGHRRRGVRCLGDGKPPHCRPPEGAAAGQPDGFAEFERAYGGTAVKIVQFYSREGTLFEGSTTVLCYGLANARSVRIEPPVEGVGVSLNRCVEVAPERDTRYTLTAEGNDGHVVSESFVLKVRPDPDTLPKITSFRMTKHEIDHGRWDGRSEAQIEAAEPEAFAAYNRHPDFCGAPGGETGYQVAARAMPVIEHVIDSHDEGDVLVVSHKGTIRIVVCALLGIGIGLYRARIAQPAASFTVFEIGPDGEPGSCHTIRPRLVGRNALDTKWVAKGSDFRLWNSMRMANRIEVWWEIPNAPFCYYRSEVLRCEQAT